MICHRRRPKHHDRLCAAGTEAVDAGVSDEQLQSQAFHVMVRRARPRSMFATKLAGVSSRPSRCAVSHLVVDPPLRDNVDVIQAMRAARGGRRHTFLIGRRRTAAREFALTLNYTRVTQPMG